MENLKKPNYDCLLDIDEFMGLEREAPVGVREDVVDCGGEVGAALVAGGGAGLQEVVHGREL